MQLLHEGTSTVPSCTKVRFRTTPASASVLIQRRVCSIFVCPLVGGSTFIEAFTLVMAGRRAEECLTTLCRLILKWQRRCSQKADVNAHPVLPDAALLEFLAIRGL